VRLIALFVEMTGSSERFTNERPARSSANGFTRSVDEEQTQNRSDVHVLVLILAFGFQSAFGAPGQSLVEAQEHADRGMSLAARNDLKAAEAEFRQAVELSPNYLPFLANLGSILGAEHKLEESTLYLQRALKLDPDNIAVRRDLASNQWQTGHLPEAQQNLERILKEKPGEPRTILLLGMVLEAREDYADAARSFESVRGLVKEQPESIAALARAYYHIGEKERALRTLNDLLDHPSGDRGLFLGAKAAADSADYDTAERLLRSLRSAYPDPSTLGYQVALVQYRAGRFEQCQNTLANVVAGGHERIDIYNLLALCYHRQGKEDEAIRTLNESLVRIPHTEADYLTLGNMLLRHKLFTAALATAKKALEAGPESEKAYELKGTAELELYFYKDATQSFSRALQLDTSSAEADLGLALAQWGAGEVSHATTTFEDGLKRFPRDTQHYTRYARLLLEVGEQKADSGMESHAVSLLKAAINLDPSQADPHYQLGNFLLKKEKTPEALRELETAARLDADTSSIHFALARAYRRMGRGQEASKEMQLFDKLKAQEDSQL
jgi:tetratricopeptide (TPR) repeat protein